MGRTSRLARVLGRASDPARERESKLLRLGAISDIGDRAEMSYKKRNFNKKIFLFMQNSQRFNWWVRGDLQMIVDMTRMTP